MAPWRAGVRGCLAAPSAGAILCVAALVVLSTTHTTGNSGFPLLSAYCSVACASTSTPASWNINVEHDSVSERSAVCATITARPDGPAVAGGGGTGLKSRLAGSGQRPVYVDAGCAPIL